MVQTVLLEAFRSWFLELDQADARAVMNALHLLEVMGLRLGAPHSSALEGTTYPLRELRPKAGHSPLRIVYAFNPERSAVVIIGGDKSDDRKFYKRIIEVAERLWEEHLAEVAARREEGRHKKEERNK